ncbi:MAG: GntR family transcriptional regulator [Tagaea sp.]|nr:GntR family transcriptional regulator [Tagaea sp.]
MEKLPARRADPAGERGRLAAQDVLDRLRELILTLKLAPGAVLSRVELARRFGVSQTPVRDALAKLSEEGLVEVFPQHATVVRTIDLAAAREENFLRRAIEMEIAHTLALSPDAAMLRALHECLERQREYAAREAREAFVAEDDEFHRIMYMAAGVPGLLAIVRRNSGQLARLRRALGAQRRKARKVIEEHRAILDAIEARQPDVARAMARKHLSDSLARIEKLSAHLHEFMRAPEGRGPALTR